jgi:membrane-associated phospholipid phosphatase
MGFRLGRPGQPLLAGSARRRAGALLACCAVLVTVLGLVFAHQSKADWLDRAVDSPVITWLSGHPGLAAWLAAPGTLIPAAALSAAIVAGCLLADRLNGALLAASAIPVTAALNEGLLKHLVHRTYLGALSYPSGHTATTFALAATVAVVLLPLPRTARSGALRALAVGAACMLGAVAAVGVIGLRWHYFTDTVAGGAVGIGTVCGLGLLLDLPVTRRQLAWACRLAPTARERRAQRRAGVQPSSSGRDPQDAPELTGER